LEWRFWLTATTRPRTLPASFSGEDTSTSARPKSQEPAVSLALPWNSAVGRLRTRLMVAPGVPAPLIRPEAPRTISARSNMAMSLVWKMPV
jgi:hypothetical protein